MKIYKKLGLLAVICLLAMTLVPTTNAATAPAVPAEIRATRASETSILLEFPQIADNNTHIEYLSATDCPNAAFSWAINVGTVCFNASTGTSYTLEGLTADTTYYFQCWNQVSGKQENTESATNATCNLHLPPASASGGSTNPPMTPPAVDDTIAPPLTIGDEPWEIPGFELLTLIAAIGICFLIFKRK